MNTFCKEHWEEARRRWEAKRMLLVASLESFRVAMEYEPFLRACGWDPERGTLADVAQAPEELQRLGPPCCWLPDFWKKMEFALANPSRHDCKEHTDDPS